jgi:hypothetical protein
MQFFDTYEIVFSRGRYLAGVHEAGSLEAAGNAGPATGRASGRIGRGKAVILLMKFYGIGKARPLTLSLSAGFGVSVDGQKTLDSAYAQPHRGIRFGGDADRGDLWLKMETETMADQPINRREFLGRCTRAGLSVAAAGALGIGFYDGQGPEEFPRPAQRCRSPIFPSPK